MELAQRSGVTPVRLDRNYRCGDEIIRVANRLRPASTKFAAHAQAATSRRRAALTASMNNARLRRTPRRRPATAVSPWTRSSSSAHWTRSSSSAHRTSYANKQPTRSARGLPAAVREAEYRMTQVTSFVEGCATWAVLGRELSNYRLSGLLGQWRAILGPRWDRQADVSLTTLLLGYADKADEPARLLLKFSQRG
jgi:ATP-dependent DNA helicase UvrD/PcrA